MKLIVNYHPHQDEYHARIWDGPDGIDEETFISCSLGDLFEKIVAWRTLNALSYREPTENV